MVAGAALIIEPHQTIVVEPGWQAEVTARNHIVLTRVAAAPHAHRDRHRRRSGDARGLQQPLHVDRRADGRDAPEHRLLGEHQGAARLLLRRLRRRRRGWSPTPRTCRSISARWTARSRRSSASTKAEIRPGDVFALNAPYNGGTHLPDITVCTPVFDDAGDAILFWVASRGHHADVGGTAPGSMTPRATTVEEEGVLIDNFRLVEGGPVPRGGARRAAHRPSLAGAATSPRTSPT